MRKLITAVILALSLCGQGNAAELSDLEWLSGHWFSEDKAYEEAWIAPKAGSMSGSFRWVFPNGKQVLEYLLIERASGASRITADVTVTPTLTIDRGPLR